MQSSYNSIDWYLMAKFISYIFYHRTLLFDTGPVDFAIGYNGKRLGINFEAVDAIMISHGHWDHAGKNFVIEIVLRHIMCYDTTYILDLKLFLVLKTTNNSFTV